jgi:hypothetical protein
MFSACWLAYASLSGCKALYVMESLRNAARPNIVILEQIGTALTLTILTRAFGPRKSTLGDHGIWGNPDRRYVLRAYQACTSRACTAACTISP